MLKTDWRTFAIRNTASHCTRLAHDRSCFLGAAETRRVAPGSRRRAMGAILRVKELTIDRVVSIAAEPGPRRAGPVTASFKPALLGEYALRRGQGRTSPSSNIFSS